MNPEQVLIVRAAALRRAAPGLFEEFLGALQNQVGFELMQLAQASRDELPRFQGYVQSTIHFTKMLEGCVTTAEAILAQRQR